MYIRRQIVRREERLPFLLDPHNDVRVHGNIVIFKERLESFFQKRVEFVRKATSNGPQTNFMIGY